MTPIPGAHVVTISNPIHYLPSQLDRAAAIAHAMQRGQFILVEPPRR